MNNKIGRLSLVFASIVISPFVAHVTAALNNFIVGEVGGYFYLFIVAPVIGLILGCLLLVPLWRRLDNGPIIIFAALAVVILSSGIHFWMLLHHQIGGWYRLPAGYTATDKSVDELCTLVYDRNSTIQGVAWAELERRGKSSTDALLCVIETNKSLLGTKFIDDSITGVAIEMLATLQDPRAIPILQQMLTSDQSFSDPYNSKRRIYPTRRKAKHLLEAFFQKKVDVPTEVEGTTH